MSPSTSPFNPPEVGIASCIATSISPTATAASTASVSMPLIVSENFTIASPNLINSSPARTILDLPSVNNPTKLSTRVALVSAMIISTTVVTPDIESEVMSDVDFPNLPKLSPNDARFSPIFGRVDVRAAPNSAITVPIIVANFTNTSPPSLMSQLKPSILASPPIATIIPVRPAMTRATAAIPISTPFSTTGSPSPCNAYARIVATASRGTTFITAKLKAPRISPPEVMNSLTFVSPSQAPRPHIANPRTAENNASWPKPFMACLKSTFNILSTFISKAIPSNACTASFMTVGSILSIVPIISLKMSAMNSITFDIISGA